MRVNSVHTMYNLYCWQEDPCIKYTVQKVKVVEPLESWRLYPVVCVLRRPVRRAVWLPAVSLVVLHNCSLQFLISVLFCNFSKKSLHSLNMLGPLMSRENAFHSKFGLPVHWHTKRVQELEGPYSAQPHRHSLFTVCLFCTRRCGAGHSCHFIYLFNHLYIPLMQLELQFYRFLFQFVV